MTSCTSSSRSTVTTPAGGGGELRGDPVGVGRLRDPARRRARGISTRASLSRTTSSDRKFSPTKSPRLSPSTSFLRRDDRGVRDRQPERAAEQRRHREPVGQRADHAGLGHGADVADPAGAAVDLPPPGEQEDHRRRRAAARWRAASSGAGRGPGLVVHPADTQADGDLTTRDPDGAGRRVRSGGMRSGHKPIVPVPTNTWCPDRATCHEGAPGPGSDTRWRGPVLARPGPVPPGAVLPRGPGRYVTVALAGVDGVPPTPATLWVRPRDEGEVPPRAPHHRLSRSSPARCDDRGSGEGSRGPARGRSGPHTHRDDGGGPLGARPACHESVRHRTASATAAKITSAYGSRYPVSAGATRQCTQPSGTSDGGARTVAPRGVQDDVLGARAARPGSAAPGVTGYHHATGGRGRHRDHRAGRRAAARTRRGRIAAGTSRTSSAVPVTSSSLPPSSSTTGQPWSENSRAAARSSAPYTAR